MTLDQLILILGAAAVWIICTLGFRWQQLDRGRRANRSKVDRLRSLSGKP